MPTRSFPRSWRSSIQRGRIATTALIRRGWTAARCPPNDPDHGTHHQWEVWNSIDYTAYRSEIPRFCSEFGFQAPPAWRTLTDWVHAVDGGALEAASDPKNDANFLLHQKAA